MFEVDPDDGPDRIDVWDGHARRTLVAQGAFPRYAAPGYLMFNRGDAIWALRIVGTKADGEPFPVVDHASYPSASNAGSLLYKAAGGYDETLIWVDRGGAMREAIVSSDAVVRNPALSPDETQIAFDGAAGIRVLAPGRGVRAALGATDSIQREPAWSAAGDRIVYVSSRTGGRDQEDDMIRMAGLDGGVPITMADSGFDPAISSDGRYFTYTTGNVSNQSLWYRDLRASQSAARVFPPNPPAFAGSFRVSPDDRYAAFVAGDWKSGTFEIYLSRFPGGEDRTQVSSGGVRYTSHVYWSAAGDQLYYVRASDGALMVTDVTAGAQIRLSTPRVLFTESTADLSLGAGIAVSKNPSRFLAVRRTVKHGGAPSAFVLLDSWRATKLATRAP
jgi:Tol biopolymer transport system component